MAQKLIIDIKAEGVEATEIKQFLKTIASQDLKILAKAAKSVNKNPKLIQTALKFL